ncbi:Uncharacterised protein [Actinobacillus ureae]|uniref:Uncharacterized protein n=1 Tax=Actinobacillus ureae ATCC 25976 TaxID=887324 RepID=E8KK29_9PAST|nr:hypothetical protein [Actinobacillus ureae]EFX90747.1 hypothetical protein HMPREF0027_2196 [Actinobacillus ureae ATCC 25976]SUT87448.1 Uncharacterised protein [Actinobacillus ureae]SUU48868.1 Uncharacterised protein [Actinobacillus ureae]
MEYVLINYQGSKHKISIENFECDLVDSDERQMGAENCYKFYNDEYGISRYLYEYPIGCFNYSSEWECDSDTEILEDTINYSSFFIAQD